jgi:RNA polymerase sigma-70 factor (ECF subfamily)
MPPYTMWVTGPDAIVRLITAQCPSGPGDHRFVATAANGAGVRDVHARA